MANSGTRDRIVDAAMSIVREQGPGRLTLDEAARVAHVSKGGVLYHFKSKDELLREMVHRLLDRCDDLTNTFHAEEPEGPYRMARALVRAAFDPLGPGNDPVGAAALAAATLNPSLLDPVRHKFEGWKAEIQASSPDPALAYLIVMAMDGLFLNRVTGLNLYDDGMLDQIKQKALSLLVD